MNVKADDSDAWGYIESIARPLSSKVPFVYTPERDARALSSDPGVSPSYIRDEKDVCSSLSKDTSYEEFSIPHAVKIKVKHSDLWSNGAKPKSMEPIYQENCGLVSCIDKNTKTRIDKGLYPIDKLLDLHGYSQDTACGVLLNFITSSFMSGHRCVLVITGWGSKNSGKNSIKSNFHKWLQSTKISNMLLYYTQAIPSHGGKGAFYVLLRNKQKFA